MYVHKKAYAFCNCSHKCPMSEAGVVGRTDIFNRNVNNEDQRATPAYTE